VPSDVHALEVARRFGTARRAILIGGPIIHRSPKIDEVAPWGAVRQEQVKLLFGGTPPLLRPRVQGERAELDAGSSKRVHERRAVGQRVNESEH